MLKLFLQIIHDMDDMDVCANIWQSMYRSTIEEYSGAIKKLAETLLSILSEYLDLHPTRLQEAIGELYQNINFGYYPPCPQSENVQGMASHSDYGALTILWQNEVNGLQVRKSGKWIMVKPTVPGALIVNAGDTLEVISTDDKT
jgi:isopenicillin N synthase-like dioxygenase